jgi:integrase
VRLHPLPKGTSRAKAEEKALLEQQEADREDCIRPSDPGTVSSSPSVQDYAERWASIRRKRGVGTAENTDYPRLRRHLFKVRCDGILLGQKPIANVTAEDLRKMVGRLDDLVHDESVRFTGNTASKVWGAITKMFGDACRSKVAELRVREGNPAAEVERPDRGHKPAKQWLYPDEFVQLVACESDPLRWRRMYCLALHFFTRAGELEVLDWKDVDLAHGRVRIHRARDRFTGEIKETKEAEVREFAFEPTLLPLLNALHKERGSGVVVKMPPVEWPSPSGSTSNALGSSAPRSTSARTPAPRSPFRTSCHGSDVARHARR